MAKVLLSYSTGHQYVSIFMPLLLEELRTNMQQVCLLLSFEEERSISELFLAVSDP
jgi:hypothetical protein